MFLYFQPYLWKTPKPELSGNIQSSRTKRTLASCASEFMFMLVPRVIYITAFWFTAALRISMIWHSVQLKKASNELGHGFYITVQKEGRVNYASALLKESWKYVHLKYIDTHTHSIYLVHTHRHLTRGQLFRATKLKSIHEDLFQLFIN